MWKRLGSSFVLVLASAASAQAHVYVVDDNGGPDVHFQSLGQAAAVVQDGDVVVVRGGIYLAPTFDKGVTIVAADPDVRVAGNFVVRNVSAGRRAHVAGLTLVPVMVGSVPSLTVEDCAGTVILERIACPGPTAILSCSDVRLRGVQLRGPNPQLDGPGNGRTAVSVHASRIEIVESVLLGSNAGNPPFTLDVGRGGDALVVGGASEVHVHLSTLQAGNGGDGTSSTGIGGDGGHGIRIGGDGSGRARLLVTGTPAHEIRGGSGGAGATLGADGVALHAEAADARISGATLATTSIAPDATLERPGRPDPWLELLGGTAVGSPATYRVRGVPGSRVRFVLGRTTTVIPTPGLDEDVLVLPGRIVDAGLVGAGGTLDVVLSAAPSWPHLVSLVAQADVELPGGAVLRTNSVPALFH